MAGRPKLPKQAPDFGPPVPLLYKFDLRPRAQQRDRSAKTKYGNMYNYTPDETRFYEAEINRQAMQQHPLPEPFTADLAVVINLRFRDSRNGDIDNIVKSLLDGMSPKYENGRRLRDGVFRTDKVIKKLTVEIFYDDAHPCSEVILYRHYPRAWSERVRFEVIRLWLRLANWFGASSSE